MIYFGWFITLVSIAGVILNIKKHRSCFFLWAGTNAYWALIDFNAGIYSQAALQVVYFCLAIWGIVEWRRGR